MLKKIVNEFHSLTYPSWLRLFTETCKVIAISIVCACAITGCEYIFTTIINQFFY